MIRSIKSISFMAGVYLLGLILTGCGGGGSAGNSGSAPDVGLASLSLEGYDIEFDRTKTGPYTVSVESDVSQVRMTAISSSDETELVYTLESTRGNAGELEPVSLESGAAVDLRIGEGDNLLTVFVLDQKSRVAGQYYVTIHRTSTSASLLPLSQFRNPFNDGAVITLSPTFASNTFNYTANIGYTGCAVDGYLFTSERNSTITVNGERVVHARTAKLPLAVGENLLATVVTAEDGVTSQTYNFTVTRAAPTEAQLEEDATLSSLVLSEGELRFDCSTTEYGVSLNRDTAAVDITAAVAADGATLTINEETAVSGEPFNIVLQNGENEIEIEVTAADGETSETYTLILQRLNTNLVYVETAEELQSALRNAEPGDEIRVLSGRYEGVASLDASGNADAHFYSDRSGTVDDPIRLVGASLNTAVLGGTDTSANTVFLLTGNYWRISDLQFTEAKNGVVLSGANNNQISRVSIKETGEQAMLIRNGSSNNIVDTMLISKTGIGIASDRIGHAEGIVIGSDDSEWVGAPGDTGQYNEQDYDNVIRNTEFLSSVASEAIEINEGTLRTIVEHNIFTSGSLTNAAGDSSLLNIQGNDAIVRYNTFYYEDDENLAEIISVNDDSAAWNTAVAWGENAEIYQNFFVLDKLEIPLVRAQDVAAVYVADNTRNDDDVEPSYAGSGINQNFSSPTYKIQLAADDSVCLDIEEVEITRNGQAELRGEVYLKECGSAQSQLWRLVMDEDKYIRIQNVQFAQKEIDGEPKDLFVTQAVFNSSCPTDDDEIPALFLNAGIDGYLQRWGTTLIGDGIKFFNKYSNSFSITAPDDFRVNAGVTSCISSTTNEERQILRLIEQ